MSKQPSKVVWKGVLMTAVPGGGYRSVEVSVPQADVDKHAVGQESGVQPLSIVLGVVRQWFSHPEMGRRWFK